jgi:hypothetical protein
MSKDKELSEKEMAKLNAVSVLKKLAEGIYIILLVGLGAFAALLILMNLL